MNQQMNKLRNFDDQMSAIEPGNRVWLERGMSVGSWLRSIFLERPRNAELGPEITEKHNNNGMGLLTLRSPFGKLFCVIPLLLACISIQAADINRDSSVYQMDGLDVYVEDLRNFANVESTESSKSTLPSTSRTHSPGDTTMLNINVLRTLFHQSQYNVMDELGTYTEDFRDDIAGTDLTLIAQ